MESKFSSLISFANEALSEDNWENALWNVMGDERLSRVKYKVNGKTFEESMWHSDIYSELTEKLGYGLLFPSEKLDEILKSVEEAIEEVKPGLPKVTGHEPTLEDVRELHKAVKEILDLLAEGGSCEHQQENWVRLTGREFNFWELSHVISNPEQYEKLSKKIRIRFGEWSSRTAIVNGDGSLYFEDMGVDASRTLSWMLSGLINLVLDDHNPLSLKKCLWCGKYFFHSTRRPKTFCSDTCRYDYHNKGKDVTH